ncbi:ATP-binding cassette domain-containing protein [Plebeiibacterium sediminum]|uniref:ATP-binding cassette domain-containing protein n=1 Tax=Plebeiibacterium sediminum TaxID=2992112 RepID=A0AAE3M4G1_9BACT|nr:ATP-binding cassette domain-containing protein [Plebeiobacterium sediminum]MCW3786475.1 ATP-binding cassette domain-containing protein [Plebeiobacterium sediminum]
MSEGILKALIQLFALIAFPQKDSKSRRNIVKNFLDQQLNKQMVEEYLNIYEKHYQEHVSKLKKLQNSEIERSTLTANSVKALRISTAINKELVHYQKLIVIIQLIEFLKSGVEISRFEKDFVYTIAQTFHISDEEYHLMEDFIIGDMNTPVNNNNLLIINKNKGSKYSQTRHLQWANLKQEIHILRIKSGSLFLLRLNDNVEISINGQLLATNRVHVLTPGCSLRNNRIDPIYYSDIVGKFTSDNISEPITFNVNNISYAFKNKTIGIQPLSFYSESGRLVGIMGASGAGKTTLTNILSGIVQPQEGNVKINNVDIHKNPKKIEGLIGYVSQDDLLMENLTVYQNLYYNAKLCFGDYSELKIQKRVLSLLSSLGLHEIKDMKVGSPLNKKISGGQRKRLNIALELIREPAILFLDEPTSGLSSKDSANILDLLKELALKGKLVFVVIHQPSSDIFKMFNQLLVMDNGGYLIYDGDPVESINYFKSSVNQANKQESECHTCGNVNPEQVLNIVSSQIIDEYGTLTRSRKIEPDEWHQRFKEYKPESKRKESLNDPPSINFKIPNKLKQLSVFIKRDVLSKLSNKQYLLINLLETPILAILLSSIIKFYNVDTTNNQGYVYQDNPNIVVYIIMAVIIALFVGLTVSAEEIIRDKKILKREAFLNLSRLSYLLSKFFILGFISAIQTLLFVAIGNTIIEIKGMFFEYWIILFSASVFSNLLGLIISDSFKDAINIYILIPFLLIPQIILSGVFISYDNLNPKLSNPEKIPWYGEGITARWAFEALAVNQFKNNKYEREFYTFDKIKSEAKFKKEYWIPSILAKLDDCLKYYENQDIENLNNAFSLIENEIAYASNNGILKDKFYAINAISDTFNIDTYNKLKEEINSLKKDYIKIFNKTDELLDNKKKQFLKTNAEKEEFNNLKRLNYNLELERFVRNTNNIFSNKIIEYNGKLLQKSDPIFKDPQNNYLLAHFLSPYKKIGSIKIDTIWANTIVIWLYNIVLFLILYSGILKEMLHIFEEKYNKLKNKRE